MTAITTGFLVLASGAAGVASFCAGAVAVLCVPARNWGVMAACGAASLAAAAVCLAAAQAVSR